MQIQLILLLAPFLLFSNALLSGCDSREKEASSLKPFPAPIGSTKASEAMPIIQTFKQPQQPNIIMSQPASATDRDISNLAIGEGVYKSTCSICHKSGLNGAPRIGSKKDWESRLAQGNEVLYDRAINGYRGSKGSMPSRGSNPRLSEAEVKAAVDYMVLHSIPSWSVE